MAPVIAVAPHPGRNAGADHRAVDPRGELLDAGEEGVAVDDEGKRRMMPASGSASMVAASVTIDGRSSAVGIEHDHMRVAAAPSGDEILNVSGFAADVLRPMSIE